MSLNFADAGSAKSEVNLRLARMKTKVKWASDGTGGGPVVVTGTGAAAERKGSKCYMAVGEACTALGQQW